MFRGSIMHAEVQVGDSMSTLSRIDMTLWTGLTGDHIMLL
jgi:hypothetical protein